MNRRSRSKLPKRTNPHLLNLSSPTPTPPKPNHGITPRIMTVMGIGILTMSTYCGYLYASYKREATKSQSLAVPSDVSDRYNHTADTFDADVEMSETVMRMGRKRQDLARLARGDVLEVSCGTGRNLEFYDLSLGPWACRSVVFVDLSRQMVDVTRRKFEKFYQGRPDLQKRVSFQVLDAAAVTSPPTKTGYFDTIIQTMGLCSMPDPAGTLRHLGTLTEPQQGHILLLEHGRSYYDWVNRILDNLAPVHADRHGCWWNRDIGEMVRESGLEVEEERRWHFGTTWWFVLRPKREP